MFMVF